MMMNEQIQKTEAFLKAAFDNSPYLQDHPQEMTYRLEHSYRVANIGKVIALAEGFDLTAMVIGCLLHDIAYCQEMPSWEVRKQHGRESARIARPFLETLGLEEDLRMDILYGIAIHVDDASDFEWRRTSFAESIADADNIDRFDSYRIYETLESVGFSRLSLAEKRRHVLSMLERLSKLRTAPAATQTARKLWQQRMEDYTTFYEKLRSQLERSEGIL